MERSLTSNWAWRRGSKEKDLVKNEENTIPREENVTLKKKSLRIQNSLIHLPWRHSCEQARKTVPVPGEHMLLIVLKYQSLSSWTQQAAGSYHRFLVRKFLVLEDLYDHPKDDFWQGREPGSVGAPGKAFLGQVGRECQEPGGGCIQGTWHKAPKMWLWPKCVCPLMAKRRVAETGRDRLRKEGALNTMSERPSSALLCLEDRPP